MSDADTQLDGLRASLLSGRPRALLPDEGDEAFRQHKLLASAVHRAAKLNARKRDKTETEQWARYVTEHFPAGRNDPADAKTLWTDWRTSMLKKNTPGLRIGVTHGQSHAHWYREPGGLLCLNLEDMWDDFEASVEHFIDELRANAERRKVVLKRWRESTWDVRQLLPTDPGAWVGATAVSASVADSISVVELPPQPPRE